VHLEHTLTNDVIACSTLGIPVMVVTILVVLHDRKDFITKHACWCRGDGALFVTFLAIIGLILLVIKLSLSTRIINILMTGPIFLEPAANLH
jgi:hypothetical protein